jgi:hypothetical protein
MNYGVHISPGERQEEMARRVAVLENEPEAVNKPGEALRVARLARISGEWETIVSRLSPYAGIEGTVETPALLPGAPGPED